MPNDILDGDAAAPPSAVADIVEADTDFPFAQNDDGSFTLALAYPVSWGQDKSAVSELTLRRPNGGDLLAMDKGKGDNEKGQILLGRIIGKPAGFVSRMDAYDIAQGNKITEHFLSKSPSTGTSS